MEAAARIVVHGVPVARPWLKWSPARLTAFRQHVLHLSPEQMATELHARTGEPITGNSIRRWESGQHVPSVDNLVSICNAFEVDAGLFLEQTDRPAAKRKS